jgi:hypothetical protein
MGADWVLFLGCDEGGVRGGDILFCFPLGVMLTKQFSHLYLRFSRSLRASGSRVLDAGTRVLLLEIILVETRCCVMNDFVDCVIVIDIRMNQYISVLMHCTYVLLPAQKPVVSLIIEIMNYRLFT